MKYCARLFGLALCLLGLTCGPEPRTTQADLPPWCRVYFSPRDPVPDYLVSLVDDAREKVWAAFYSLTLEEVASAFLRARTRGVDVRVIMDDKESRPRYSQGPRLAQAGLLKTDLSPSDFMHNKFMVIDGFITWTGSYNPSLTGSARDDNNVIVIASRDLARRYEEEFEEMWRGRFGRASLGPMRAPALAVGGVAVEAYFAPEDDCAGRLLALIRGARKSIRFAVFSFTLVPVAEALVKQSDAGIEVAGVLERGQDSPWNCYRILKDSGLDVVWDQNLYYLHHKFFVIDEKVVVTGSFNPSRHAQTSNDENLLVVHHEGVARKFLEEFRRLRERKWE